MKKNKGITMITLILTIIVLLVISGISIGIGNNIIKKSELENLKTNMLLIKVKAKEYAENANFKLGTNIGTSTDKLEEAKKELKGEEITDTSIFNGNISITQDDIQKEYIYYYKLSKDNLTDIGLSNIESDEESGWYIIKYDLKNIDIEIYNTKGFENENNKYYSLTDIQNLNM